MADGDELDMAEELQKMKAMGRTVSPQAPHRGSKSGQTWEPDEQTRQRLGDTYGIIKEIIEEP